MIEIEACEMAESLERCLADRVLPHPFVKDLGVEREHGDVEIGLALEISIQRSFGDSGLLGGVVLRRESKKGARKGFAP